MPTIQELVESKDWDAVRESLCRAGAAHDRSTLTAALDVALYDKATPGSIVRSFLVQLREHRKVEVTVLRPFVEFPRLRNDYFRSVIWFEVCCFGTWNGQGPTDAEWVRLCTESSPETFRALIEEYRHYNEEAPPSVSLPMNEVIDSVSLMYRCYLAPRQEAFTYGTVRADKQKEEEFMSIESIEALRHTSSLYDLWRKTELLIFFATQGESPLPHALVKEKFPSLLVWLAGKLHPEKFRERDHSGRLPLHYVSGRCHSLAVVFSREHSFLNQEGNVLNIVSNVFHTGARFLNKRGKLPLTLQIESKGNDIGVSGLMHMINLAPQALLTRDKETHLFPFMSAARCPHAKIDDIFLLLREDPSVIVGTNMSLDRETRLSYYEQHLKRKLLDSERKIVKLKRREIELSRENMKLRAQIESFNGKHLATKVEQNSWGCGCKRARMGQ